MREKNNDKRKEKTLDHLRESFRVFQKKKGGLGKFGKPKGGGNRPGSVSAERSKSIPRRAWESLPGGGRAPKGVRKKMAPVAGGGGGEGPVWGRGSQEPCKDPLPKEGLPEGEKTGTPSRTRKKLSLGRDLWEKRPEREVPLRKVWFVKGGGGGEFLGGVKEKREGAFGVVVRGGGGGAPTQKKGPFQGGGWVCTCMKLILRMSPLERFFHLKKCANHWGLGSWCLEGVFPRNLTRTSL